MKNPLALFLSIVLLFFGVRMTSLVSDAAHYLMHRGDPFDPVIGFVLIFIAPSPFLLCCLVAVFVWGRWVNGSDGSPQ